MNSIKEYIKNRDIRNTGINREIFRKKTKCSFEIFQYDINLPLNKTILFSFIVSIIINVGFLIFDIIKNRFYILIIFSIPVFLLIKFKFYLVKITFKNIENINIENNQIFIPKELLSWRHDLNLNLDDIDLIEAHYMNINDQRINKPISIVSQKVYSVFYQSKFEGIKNFTKIKIKMKSGKDIQFPCAFDYNDFRFELNKKGIKFKEIHDNKLNLEIILMILFTIIIFIVIKYLKITLI